MENFNQIFKEIPEMNLSIILTVLGITLILSIYEFCIYRFVSRKALYNKQLNISLTVLPCFIATIILALQSNIVITLGTIGALAIIRYRTAIKDPIDMVYILWSVHIGIVCGCQLYSLGFITSLLVSIVIFAFEKIKFATKPIIFCVRSSLNIEDELTQILKDHSANFLIKSRNFSNNTFDFIIETSTKFPKIILDRTIKIESCIHAQMIEYDSNNGFI
jgi:uncharacterized membrane protein YhiD involved in acid resistance